MPTTKIMLIRHAEKPNSDLGFMPDGARNPEALPPVWPGHRFDLV